MTLLGRLRVRRKKVESKTGYLVTVQWQGKKASGTFITWTVVTDDPEEAVHTVKQRLCLRGYEKKFSFPNN